MDENYDLFDREPIHKVKILEQNEAEEDATLAKHLTNSYCISEKKLKTVNFKTQKSSLKSNIKIRPQTAKRIFLHGGNEEHPARSSVSSLTL